jgi:hypothetical protein
MKLKGGRIVTILIAVLLLVFLYLQSRPMDSSVPLRPYPVAFGTAGHQQLSNTAAFIGWQRSIYPFFCSRLLLLPPFFFIARREENDRISGSTAAAAASKGHFSRDGSRWTRI